MFSEFQRTQWGSCRSWAGVGGRIGVEGSWDEGWVYGVVWSHASVEAVRQG